MAIGGMGLLAGGAQQASAQAAQASTLETVPMSNDAWFAERAWSVSVTITSALASTSMLRLSQTITYQTIHSSANGPVNRTVAFSNQSLYGLSAPIPAPGAIALLGLSGLAGSRRRRIEP
jgi:hypothetical protein